jgi:hypothetical protein
VQAVICSNLSMATLLLPLARLLWMEAAAGTALMLVVLLVLLLLVSTLGALVRGMNGSTAAHVSACLLTYDSSDVLLFLLNDSWLAAPTFN